MTFEMLFQFGTFLKSLVATLHHTFDRNIAACSSLGPTPTVLVILHMTSES